MQVRCERDGYEWNAVPREVAYRKEYAKEDGFAWPVRCIDCPRCFRGYYQEADGKWRSDRELTIL